MLEDEGYSAEYRDDMMRRDGSYNHDGSYARGRTAKRDSMGRYSRRGYSRANDEIIDQLHGMMNTAKDDHVRREIRDLIDRMEKA